MSKIKCGTLPLKEGEKRGSIKECADKRQIRYYGLNKVEPSQIKNKATEKEKLKILKEIARESGKINRLEKSLKTKDIKSNEAKVKEHNENIKKSKEQLQQARDKLKQFISNDDQPKEQTIKQDKEMTRQEILIKLAGINGAMSRNKRILENSKDDKQKEKAEKDNKQLLKQIEELKKKL